MRRSRRQIVNRIAEVTGLLVVALDILLFFLIYQPLGAKIASVDRQVEGLRRTIRNQQARVEVLQKFQNAMPETRKGLADFMANRIPPRREGYSMTDHLIHKVGDAANVKITGLAFRLSSDRTDPLLQLEVEVNVQGTYSALMKFAHALETANSILLEREAVIAQGTAGILSMRLAGDVYLTP